MNGLQTLKTAEFHQILSRRYSHEQTRSSVSLNLRVMFTKPYNKYRAISSLTLILRSLAGYSCSCVALATNNRATNIKIEMPDLYPSL